MKKILIIFVLFFFNYQAWSNEQYIKCLVQTELNDEKSEHEWIFLIDDEKKKIFQINPSTKTEINTTSFDKEGIQVNHELKTSLYTGYERYIINRLTGNISGQKLAQTRPTAAGDRIKGKSSRT